MDNIKEIKKTLAKHGPYSFIGYGDAIQTVFGSPCVATSNKSSIDVMGLINDLSSVGTYRGYIKIDNQLSSVEVTDGIEIDGVIRRPMVISNI